MIWSSPLPPTGFQLSVWYSCAQMFFSSKSSAIVPLTSLARWATLAGLPCSEKRLFARTQLATAFVFTSFSFSPPAPTRDKSRICWPSELDFGSKTKEKTKRFAFRPLPPRRPRVQLQRAMDTPSPWRRVLQQMREAIFISYSGVLPVDSQTPAGWASTAPGAAERPEGHLQGSRCWWKRWQRSCLNRWR